MRNGLAAGASGLYLCWTATCLAQAPGQPASQIPGAVSADSAHYSVLYENAEVRVLRIHYGPHEKGNMHNHPRSVTVFLTDGQLKMTMVDGRSVVATVKAGQTVLEEAGPHQPENLSDKAFEAVRTEMKTERGASR